MASPQSQTSRIDMLKKASSGGGLLTLDETVLESLKCSASIHDLYEVEELPFARGHFASVRRCTCRTTGRQFAGKVLRRRRRPADITHEIAVLFAFADSEYIVRLHQVYESSTETIILLELMTGGELQTVLDVEEFVEERTAARFVRQLVLALQPLHDNNIAHLDIKPQNILLTGVYPDCDVKICDFGISRQISAGNELREIMGTADYMAPEVLRYEPLSLATDMWSVGVLTYALVSGYTPFSGDTAQQTFSNITSMQLDFPEELFADVSESVKDFISGLLVRTSKDRMTLEQCLAHPWLASVVSDVPTPFRPLTCSSPIIEQATSSACPTPVITVSTLSSSPDAGCERSDRFPPASASDVKSRCRRRAAAATSGGHGSTRRPTNASCSGCSHQSWDSGFSSPVSSDDDEGGWRPSGRRTLRSSARSPLTSTSVASDATLESTPVSTTVSVASSCAPRPVLSTTVTTVSDNNKIPMVSGPCTSTTKSLGVASIDKSEITSSSSSVTIPPTTVSGSTKAKLLSSATANLSSARSLVSPATPKNARAGGIPPCTSLSLTSSRRLSAQLDDKHHQPSLSARKVSLPTAALNTTRHVSSSNTKASDSSSAAADPVLHTSPALRDLKTTSITSCVGGRRLSVTPKTVTPVVSIAQRRSSCFDTPSVANNSASGPGVRQKSTVGRASAEFLCSGAVHRAKLSLCGTSKGTSSDGTGSAVVNKRPETTPLSSCTQARSRPNAQLHSLKRVH